MDLNLLGIFVQVIENGSMTAAARTLKMPVSRISRALTRLEEEVGSSLILRTTRSFQITELGRRLYQEARPLMQKLSVMQTQFSALSETLSGTIRITAPEDVGGAILSGLIVQLSQLHPQLTFELIYTDEMVDLIKSGIDIGVRIGRLKDSSLKAKRVGTFQFICVASPTYVDRAGRPRHPKELAQHACIHLVLGPSDRRQGWELTNGRSTVHVPIQARLQANHTGTVIEFARHHRGIALAPGPMVAEAIQRGELLRVLPEWNLNPFPVHLVYPPQRAMARKVRIVAEFLEKNLQPFFQD
jgi:DNA-binding transcriptional LysR family regulator